MKATHKFLSILIVGLSFFNQFSFGAYLSNIPVTIKQPNGQKINIFATGDEFYNWAHDKDGYTIIQNQATGYYCFAILDKDELVASQYIVGDIDPKATDLKPKVNIKPEKMAAIRNEFLNETPQKETIPNQDELKSLRVAQTINNLVVYIRFADQSEFPAEQANYTSMFNNLSSGANSMRNYFKEATYDQLDISSTFYPNNNGTNIISYQDNHIRDYYVPYSTTNDSGYTGFDQMTREFDLIQNAINFVENQIPTSLNIDSDNDGNVDNICFIIRGGTTAWNTLLWPHKTSLASRAEYINNKLVTNYNIQLEDFLLYHSAGVLCHEMYHTLGAPDLYHYYDYEDPVGKWDIMGDLSNPPVSFGAYMKFKYGGWITSIPEITESGTYYLNPITSSSNNCFKISIKNSPEYLVLEYRNKSGTFESNIPNSGLLVYRINENNNGNAWALGNGGVMDEVYIFRPNWDVPLYGSVTFANLSIESGRTYFHNNSNPYGFVSDLSFANIYIKNISNAGSTITFDVRFCDDENVTYSNTNSIPAFTNASNNITTSGTVTILGTNNATFEAVNEVTLNAGFEVQQGGIFEVNMNGCGEQ